MRDQPTAQELYERTFGIDPPRCPWDRLPSEARANWERIARERPARLAAMQASIAPLPVP
jgi:hypothetical protein